MLVVANWKMNKTLDEAKEFVSSFLSLSKEKRGDASFLSKNKAILCVPFTLILSVAKIILESSSSDTVLLGAQNCYFEKSGAFTGEVSANMLKDLGATYVILGHSERRSLFFETDEIINKKILAALAAGLSAILCVGENLEQKNRGLAFETIFKQLKYGLFNVEKSKLNKIIVAYEPVWAIGSKKSASVLEISATIEYIKKSIINIFGEIEGKNAKVLYGGSVNSKNAKDFFNVKSLDGVLVGKASLNSSEFFKIFNS